ncbi:MAG: hypothetical protein LBU27_03905 [Candidatus Peribacteria bacterium]|jgi:hypothetical protein|nr:hypothetical protein [Candidatus Peribacteria bacterium]
MFSKRTLHLLLTIAMIAIVCFGYSFAQTTALTATEESIQITALSLNFWISVLSRSWIIFANFAGEFLTNTRVYGSAF